MQKKRNVYNSSINFRPVVAGFLLGSMGDDGGLSKSEKNAGHQGHLRDELPVGGASSSMSSISTIFNRTDFSAG